MDVPNVRLEGTVKGDIHAPGRVILGATARVEGSVYYGVIEMTLGAQIMGKLTQVAPEKVSGQLRPVVLQIKLKRYLWESCGGIWVGRL